MYFKLVFLISSELALHAFLTKTCGIYKKLCLTLLLHTYSWLLDFCNTEHGFLLVHRTRIFFLAHDLWHHHFFIELPL